MTRDSDPLNLHEDTFKLSNMHLDDTNADYVIAIRASYISSMKMSDKIIL